MLPGVLLVKCGEGAAKAPFSGLRIDGQRVQDHDLVIRRVVLPRSARVNVRLKPVEDAGAHHGAVRLLHEQVAPLQRRLSGGAHGVHAPHPAHLRGAGLLCVVDVLIDPDHGIQICGIGLPNGDLHEKHSFASLRRPGGAPPVTGSASDTPMGTSPRFF